MYVLDFVCTGLDFIFCIVTPAKLVEVDEKLINKSVFVKKKVNDLVNNISYCCQFNFFQEFTVELQNVFDMYSANYGDIRFLYYLHYLHFNTVI